MDFNIELLPWQLEFIETPETLRCLSGASDTGKSWVCQLDLILTCLREPGALCLASATTWSHSYRAIIEPMIRYLEEQSIPYSAYGVDKTHSRGRTVRRLSDLAKQSKGEGVINFVTGSRIEIISEENMFARLRSREFSRVYLEEATVVQTKFLEKNLWEAIRRVRQKGHSHHVNLATNPDLKTHFLWQHIFDPIGKNQTQLRIYDIMIKTGFTQDEAHKRSRIYTKSLTFKNGYNRNDKEREAKILMGSEREVKRYYYGEWDTMEGQAFILEPGKHIKKLGEAERYYISFDYGFRPDPMVYLLWSYDNGILRIHDEIELFETPVNQHLDILEHWVKKYNIVGYTGDTAVGSGEIRSLFSEFQIRYYPTTKKRNKGWTQLANFIDLNQFEIDEKCEKTLRSLQSQIWINSTLIGVDCKGEFDDQADAVRYAAMCGIVQTELQFKGRKVRVL